MRIVAVLLPPIVASTLLWPCTSVESGSSPPPQERVSIEGDWTEIYCEGGGYADTVGDEKRLAKNDIRQQEVEHWSPQTVKITKDWMGGGPGDGSLVGGHFYKLNTKTNPFEIDRWWYPKEGDKQDAKRGICILKDGFLIICSNPASHDRAKKFTTKQGDTAFLFILRKGKIN